MYISFEDSDEKVYPNSKLSEMLSLCVKRADKIVENAVIIGCLTKKPGFRYDSR